MREEASRTGQDAATFDLTHGMAIPGGPHGIPDPDQAQATLNLPDLLLQDVLSNVGKLVGYPDKTAAPFLQRPAKINGVRQPRVDKTATPCAHQNPSGHFNDPRSSSYLMARWADEYLFSATHTTFLHLERASRGGLVLYAARGHAVLDAALR